MAFGYRLFPGHRLCFNPVWNWRARQILSRPYQGGHELLPAIGNLFYLQDLERPIYASCRWDSITWRRRGWFDATPRLIEVARDVAEGLDLFASQLPLHRGGGALSDEGIGAFVTAVHECYHSISLTRANQDEWESYREEILLRRTFLEESLTEFFTRRSLERWIFGGRIPARYTDAFIAYPKELRGMEWISRRLGTRIILRVWWQHTTAEREARISSALQRFIRKKLLDMRLDRKRVDRWLTTHRMMLWKMFFYDHVPLYHLMDEGDPNQMVAHLSAHYHF